MVLNLLFILCYFARSLHLMILLFFYWFAIPANDIVVIHSLKNLFFVRL